MSRSERSLPGRGAVGIDIVEIKKLARASGRWGKAFLRKVYTEKELAYARSKRVPDQHLAARFAAKEAVFKALGEAGETEFVGWRNIEVLNDRFGKPGIHWHGKAETARRKRKVRQAVISLSHTDHYAVAVAMLIPE